MTKAYSIQVGGDTLEGGETRESVSVLDGSILGTYLEADDEGLERILETAKSALMDTQNTLPTDRASALKAASFAVRDEADNLAELLTRETGKPISLAKAEVKVAASTLQTGEKEALRNRSIVEPLFVPVTSLQRMNMIRRFPRGVVLSTIPFTSPIALAAHQVAVCVASGAPQILRTPKKAALSVLEFSAVIKDALGDLAWLTTAPMEYGRFDQALKDERVAMLAFFGGRSLGLDLHKKSNGKFSALHVGGDATGIVLPDSDVKHAAECLTQGAFAHAGQNSRAIETILVHEKIYPQFRERMVAMLETKAVLGDPLDPETLVGPMVSEERAAKLESWLGGAKEAGCRVVVGGGVSGASFEATLIEDVPSDYVEEHKRPMGPVCAMRSIESLEAAVELLNRLDQDYIIAVFARDQDDGIYCQRNLQVGTIIMNEYPTEIEDGVLYYSARLGMAGHSGVRYAIDQTTLPRNLLFNNYWGD